MRFFTLLVLLITGTFFANAQQDYYWVNNSGNWSDFANHWATTDGGNTMHTAAPTAIDNVFFTSNSFTQANQTVTLDVAVEINDMLWQGGSGTQSPTLYGNFSSSLTIHGDLLFDNGVVRDLYRIIFDSPNGTIQQLDFGDNTVVTRGGTNASIVFSGGGQWELNSALKTEATLYFSEGTFNSNDYPLEIRGVGSFSSLAIVNWGSSTLSISYWFSNYYNATFNMGTSTVRFIKGEPLQGIS